jgi:flagellar biosynthesis protein FlhG
VSTKTICIASGKGGVGKTTLSINLAMALVESGQRVLYFDADMGLANAQIGLGAESILNIGHVLNHLVSLPEIVLKTPHGIDLIAGASGLAELASLNQLDSSQIISQFSSLPDEYDVLIVDCAAGISQSVLSFLEGCQIRVVVGTNELSSIADAYGLMKVMVGNLGLNDIFYLPNMVENERQGAKLFDSMNKVVQNFLATKLNYVGSVPREMLVDSSWRKATPMVKLAPTSVMTTAVRKVAAGLINHKGSAFSARGVQFFMERT